MKRLIACAFGFAAVFGLTPLSAMAAVGDTVAFNNTDKGYSGSPATFEATETWTITIPASSSLPAGSTVRLTSVSIGMNSTKDALNATRVRITVGGLAITSNPVNGTGSMQTKTKFPDNSIKQSYAFGAAGAVNDCVLTVGTPYVLAFVNESGAAVQQRLYWKQTTDAANSPIKQDQSVPTYRIAQLVEGVVVASYAATASGTCDWTGLSWSPAWPAGGSSAAIADLAVGTPGTVLTVDADETMGKMTVSSAADNDLTLALGSGKTVTAGAYDFRTAAGTVTVGFSTGAAKVWAGRDTVLTQSPASGGTIEVTSGNRGTVPGIYIQDGGYRKIVRAGGYLKVTGDTSSGAISMMDIKNGGATIELAGTHVINGDFAETEAANTRIRTTGTVMTESGNNQIKLANTVQSVFEVADGTFTLQGRVMPNQNDKNTAIYITGGELASNDDGFWYVGGGYANGTSTLNISGGAFSAVYSPYQTDDTSAIAGHTANINVSGTGVFAPTKIWFNTDGKKPTVDNTATVIANSKHKVNMTGGAFRLPAAVPNWLPVNVTQGTGEIALQSGVSEGLLRSALTVSDGATAALGDGVRTTSISGPGTVRKVGTGTTTIGSGVIQASGLDAQPLAAIEVTDGTLKLGDANAVVFSVQNRVGVPLTVTGGTLDIADAKTFSTADGSGWLYSKPITLGGQGTDRPTAIVGGSVTPYKSGEFEMLHYVGGNGANAPATFGAAIYSTYQKDNRVRTVNVEKGRGSAEGGFDLEMTGVLGTHNDSAYLNAFLFTKTGEGVLRVSNTNNFPNTTVAAGTYQLGCPEALPANLSVASTATLDLGGFALTNRSLTCGGTIANGTLVSSGVTVDLTGATIGEGLALVVDLADAIAGLKPFAGVDYAKVTTVGENKFLTYNTTTGTFTLRDDCRLGDELKWLPIGDSITEGEQYMGHPDQGDANSRGGYRYQLWNEFEQAGQVTRSVGYRTGHSSTEENPETCRWAWHAAQYGGVIMHDKDGSHGAAGMNVESTLEVAGYPDIVTVLIGVNDLSFTDGSVEQCGWVFTTWQNMVVKYADQRPHSKIVVSPLLPASGSRAYIARFNKIMRDAHAAGKAPFDRPNVVFADVPMIAFNDAYQSQYFKDGLHPNETGAKVVAAAWMKALQPVMASLAQSNAVPVQVHNGTSGKVSVRFSKAIKSIETATLTISGTNVNGRAENWTFTGPTIKSGDRRVVEFAVGGDVLGTPLIGGTYTATLTDVDGMDANGLPLPSGALGDRPLPAQIHGSGAAANVPAAFRKGFERLQTINVTECNYGGNGPNVPCERLLKAAPVTHVGYYVELQRANEAPQFVWVSMDATPFGFVTNNVGIPTVKGGVIRSKVTELQVYGNRGNFTNTAIGDTTQTGVIEFSPWTAAGTDQSGFPKEFKANKFGWNDTLTDTSTLKGCMQVARETHAENPDDYTRPAGEMIFAFNTFNSTTLTDLGIGTFSTHRNNAGYGIEPVYDWTDFVQTTGYTPFMLSAYQVKKIEIWVRVPKTSLMLFVK